MKQFKQLREDALMEKLKASAPTAEWIHDFVHSDNPKFAGKSKQERIKMALGAAYAAKRNEEVELEESYEEAEKHLSLANDADAKGDKTAYHYHMADHHDALSQWHESKGRSASADKHAEKADYHSDKYTQYANGVHEGILDTAKQVGKKVLNKLGHGSDADMRKDLQKKMGLSQTGEKPKKTNTNEAANLAQQAAIAIAIKKKKKKMMEADETLNEKFWDNEGEMVIAQCKSIADKAQKIMAMLDDESKLEAWVQAEMTTAEDAITCVHDHLTYGKDVMEEGLDEVSTNTLASYRTKADQSAHHLRLKAAMKRGSGRFPPLPGMEKDLEKHDKRIAGITTASKKLNAKGYVPPAKPNIPDNADRGYGKGRYMGDSVELDGDILDEKEVWDTPNPKKTHHKLSPQQVSRARARARAAGRPYPNLVDNMAVMKEDIVNEAYKGTGSSALKLADKVRQERLKREASEKRAGEMMKKNPEEKKEVK